VNIVNTKTQKATGGVKGFSEAVFPVKARLQLTSKGPFWLTGENRGGVLTGSVCVCVRVRVLHNRDPV